MSIQLSEHFTTGKLLRFSLPSVLMMVFISIYSVVDGFFVGRFTGSNGLAAVNIVSPLIMGIASFGFMLGAGGSAEVARMMGQEEDQKARAYFTFFTLVTIVVGVMVSGLCFILIRPICYLFGASDLIIEDCIIYGKICLAGTPLFLLQGFFQPFMVAAERPKMGFLLSIGSGIANMVLDYLLIGSLGMGLSGAACATVAGFLISSLIPLLYFFSKQTSRLSFVCPARDFRLLFRAMGNGASEMVTNLSRSLITVLFNIQLMRLLGEDGVAAISVILYIEFFFTAVFYGFSIGTGSVISFHFGAKNQKEVSNLYLSCLRIVLVLSGCMFLISEISASQMVSLFIVDNPKLFHETVWGFRIFSISFLFCGVNIFASAYFTALCNGRVSAIISFIRTFLIQAVMIFLLPVFLGINGVWLSLPVAEILTVFLSVWYFRNKRVNFGIGH